MVKQELVGALILRVVLSGDSEDVFAPQTCWLGQVLRVYIN